jgi:hypothetical protein
LTPLENFDTSHWKTADKSWMKEREKQWPEIEQMLYTLNMTKKGRGIVRRYFLKGSLPHWKKLHDWDRDSTVRHLNLLLFLYLHPSQDDTVLRPLRDQFMDHPQALPMDRLGGLTMLFSIGQGDATSGGTRRVSTSGLEKELPLAVSQLPDAPAPYADCKIVDIHTNGHNERLFNLMLPDLSQSTVQLPVTRDTYVCTAPRYFPWDHEELPLRSFRFELHDLWAMGQWLAFPATSSKGYNDMIFQYERPLDLWYHDVATQAAPEGNWLKYMLIALYRIFQVDLGNEPAESPRARFARRIRAMLTDREFSESFRALVTLAKNNGIAVRDPWSYDAEVPS